jgi:hypothetical protein
MSYDEGIQDQALTLGRRPQTCASRQTVALDHESLKRLPRCPFKEKRPQAACAKKMLTARSTFATHPSSLRTVR